MLFELCLKSPAGWDEMKSTVKSSTRSPPSANSLRPSKHKAKYDYDSDSDSDYELLG